MANQAIVGTLRALLTADTGEFETALSRAAKSAEAAANKMVSSFQGERVFKEATAIVSAVERIGGAAKLTAQEAERMAGLTYDDMLARKVAFGTPAQVIERLGQIRDELGLDGFVVEVNPGGLIPQELETRSLQLLTHEVMPHMR